MEHILSSGEAEKIDSLPLDVLVQFVRSARNHWAEVERITGDFPEDIKRVLAIRPVDMTEALEQTRAQFAVLFNPEATANFVIYLDAALRTIERLRDEQASGDASTDDPG